MVGGPKEAYLEVESIFKDLAPENGYNYVGENGAGHFVKMVHNGIEYAMMEVYAEGFEILKSKDDFDLNLDEIADLWNHGGVIRSWLLELTADS
jgi:6-phosphogluconate dehydrogenase